MSSTAQRSFGSGEIAPALHARADLARYAIGLKTCRNMVVMRAGGATKRPGTQFVDTAGTSTAYLLTLTPAVSVVASQTVGIVAELTDWVGNPIVGTFSCAFETDDAGIATVTATGPRTADVLGVSDGVTHVRATITALGLTSNDCTVTVSDFYVLHAFVGDGTFTVTTGATTAADYLIIGGGGSGASVDGTGVGGGGGGAGELIALAAQTLTPGTYPVVVGGGGIAPHADHTIGGGVFGSLPGNNGSNTTFKGYTARGGGGGGDLPGLDGGSGGGGASWGGGPSGGAGGASTAAAPGVGSAGGDGVADGDSVGAGGGGAGGAGSVGTGGVGVSNSITGDAITYATGGGAVAAHGANGGANTGDGGDGGGPGLGCDGGNGGSGVVYVSYLASSGIVASGGIMTTFST